jgi:phosphatidylinositol 3-kinase
VGRDNPAELKAQKLARSLTRGIIDPDLKPNSEEKRALQAILKLPPNKPLHADEKALLWRFRFTLKLEARALTKFLQVQGRAGGVGLSMAYVLLAWARSHNGTLPAFIS